MPTKSAETPAPIANRCACGHFPSTHMVVRPVAEGHPGSFLLAPDGPCVRCGSRCPKYTPTP